MNEMLQEPPTPSLTLSGHGQAPIGLHQPAIPHPNGNIRANNKMNGVHKHTGQWIPRTSHRRVRSFKHCHCWFRKMILGRFAAETSLGYQWNLFKPLQCGRMWYFVCVDRHTLAQQPFEEEECTFLSALMTSKCGLYCWLVRTWDLMKDIFVCLLSYEFYIRTLDLYQSSS